MTSKPSEELLQAFRNQVERQQATGRKLFHGGVPGLKAGDKILPPSVHGKPIHLEYGRDIARSRGGESPQREDRVYMTTDAQSAALFAQNYPRGWVYEVEPDGELEPDPDCIEPGLSWQAPAATVISVVYYLSAL